MEYVETNSPRWFDLAPLEGEIFELTETPNYAISNYGRLKRLEHSVTINRKGYEFTMNYKDRIVRMTKNKTGYYHFRTKKLGSLKIHRLVAVAFIPNPEDLPYINHKDENPLNNRVDNLEWCTAKYNANYGTNRERISAKMKVIRSKNCKTIKQYTLNGEFIAEYKGKEAIEKAGFTYTTVTRCCRHIYPKTQGYIWRYDDDPFTPAENHTNTDFRKKVVFAYDMDNNIVARYYGLEEAAKKVHGHVSDISQCCNGKRKNAYGFIWKYESE